MSISRWLVVPRPVVLPAKKGWSEEALAYNGPGGGLARTRQAGRQGCRRRCQTLRVNWLLMLTTVHHEKQANIALLLGALNAALSLVR